MIETFVALLLAHALADFVFQTNRMAANKRQPLMLALHFATVYATLVAATGSLHLALLALALVHVGIDIGKLALASALKGREALALFLGDQALHLASLLALALWFPDLWSQGLWASDVTGADGGILVVSRMWWKLPSSALRACNVGSGQAARSRDIGTRG